MTTKFNIGDKVQEIKNTKNYFVIKSIHIDSSGVFCSPRHEFEGGSLWNETYLELKKEKVKKYFYNFIDSDGELKLSNSKYTDDLHFQITNKNIKIFKRVDIGFIEVLT